ncbi:MAG: efflux transporter outer membrane subunit [Burkholderiaceae bacterium]|nr:efflux transporter outer membrane subunit [Burkholderiaceae bacterium]
MRSIAHMRVSTLAAAIALALSSCAVGPDFKRPEAPKSTGYTVEPLAAQPTQFQMGRDIPFAWWKTYNSPKLDALVDRALQSNPNLAAAKAALRQAHEYTVAQRGFFYPSVNLEFTPTRQKLAGNEGGNSPGVQGNGSTISTYQNPTGPAPYNGPAYYNFYTAQLALSYTPDVFGANRRQVESLQAEEDFQRFEMEAAYISLTSNVVATAIQAASLHSQIAATKDFIEANQKALKILQHQHDVGYAMGLDMAAQEQALAQAEAQLPPLQKQWEQSRDLLRVLCGATPDTALDDEFDLAALTQPADLPLSLPATLVNQRPDVRAAEEQLHSANAQVGVAHAARFPQLTITGNMGGAASEIPQMFKTGGPFWNIGGDFLQPIFDGGTLRHKELAAREALTQAQEQYRATVLNALQNVADTLHAVQSDADGLAAAQKVERAAWKTLEITRKQQKAGYVNMLTLLTAEGSYQQAVVALLQAKTNSYGDAAAMFQALGGGWWNRDGVAESSAVRSGS